MEFISPDNLSLLATIAYLYAKTMNLLAILVYINALGRRRRRKRPWITYDRANRQLIRGVNIYRLVFERDLACIESICMDQGSFRRHCDLLLTTSGKLVDTRNMRSAKMVASFLYTISHDQKNWVENREFGRLGETISRQFKGVLNAILKCHEVLLKNLEPVRENSTDEKWRWFKVKKVNLFSSFFIF